MDLSITCKQEQKTRKLQSGKIEMRKMRSPIFLIANRCWTWDDSFYIHSSRIFFFFLLPRGKVVNLTALLPASSPFLQCCVSSGGKNGLNHLEMARLLFDVAWALGPPVIPMGLRPPEPWFNKSRRKKFVSGKLWSWSSERCRVAGASYGSSFIFHSAL